MFHIKSVNNKKNLTEERKIMRNCASEILIPTFINPPQNEACPQSAYFGTEQNCTADCEIRRLRVLLYVVNGTEWCITQC